ncbi:hypothetical protein ACFE04_024787 [Oxalis oulophora]
MKTSLKKLRGLGLHRHGHGDHHHHHHVAKERRDPPPSVVQLDELAKASQDMHDMKDCYDTLLSAAAATANSAFEFSESLREMGTCLLEKTALNEDEESGKVLLMLGKAQFELQRLVDNYRSHIFQTITSPSESLLNELRTVEEMKRQCDEKRDVYDYMMRKQKDKDKGRSKSLKGGESFSSQQLKAANDEYDEEATLFIFRLKSLKQGQSRSLLTQAARHHASQLWFFKKALKSLESVDPHVKSVTEQQHIDYHFSGLEDEANESDYDYDTQDDGELSFDYGHSDQDKDVSTSHNSMELDQDEVTFPSAAAEEASKENFNRLYRKSFSFRGEVRASSQSAPLLFTENNKEKLLQMRPSSAKKFNTYVLPTPGDSKHSLPVGPGSPAPRTFPPRHQNLFYSSPLEAKKIDKTSGDDKFLGSAVISPPVLRESNNNASSTNKLPPPLAERLLFSRPDPPVASDSKKLKRQAFSGPLTSKPWSGKAVPVEQPQLFSGPLLRNPLPQPPSTSPRVSPIQSPTFLSSPKISELHELPRPPKSNFSRPSGLVGYSAPLGLKGRVPSSAPRKTSGSISASPLPKPPNTVTRSYSIPSEGHRVSDADMTGDVPSPPLTPISLYNVEPSSTGSTSKT